MTTEPYGRREEQSSVDERVGRLEISVGRLEAGQASTSAQLSAVAAQIDRLAASVNEKSRAPWALLISGAVLTLGVISGGATMCGLLINGWINEVRIEMRHVGDRSAGNKDNIDRHERSIGDLEIETRAERSKIAERLKEIETQFRSEGRLLTHYSMFNEQRLENLWRKAFGEELPPLHPALDFDISHRPANGNGGPH